MSPSQPRWLFYAIASGACAALNGVFAKLTTTQLTATWAMTLSHTFGQRGSSAGIEAAVRGFFFILNLTFNGVMWGLFTRALTLATSTVRVSVINTSANFVTTAVLGALVFGEALPGLWWLGAGLLMFGSILIGRREEAQDTGVKPPVAQISRDGGQSSSSDVRSGEKIELRKSKRSRGQS